MKQIKNKRCKHEWIKADIHAFGGIVAWIKFYCSKCLKVKKIEL